MPRWLRSVLLTLALTAAVGCGGFVRASIHIHPAYVSLAYGQTQAFSVELEQCSGSRVDWAVTEGTAGGTIGDDGVYTAPSGSGTYHVTASCHDEPLASDTATVSVP